jgi:hypothetical protein
MMLECRCIPAVVDSDQWCRPVGQAGCFRRHVKKELQMKTFVLKAMLAAAVIAAGVSGSIGWSHDNGLSLSVESAQARVGRPLTL